MLLETLCLVLTVFALGLTGAAFWLVRQMRLQLAQHIDHSCREQTRFNEALSRFQEHQVAQSLREQEDRAEQIQVDADRKRTEAEIMESLRLLKSNLDAGLPKVYAHAQNVEAGVTPWQKQTSSDIAALVGEIVAVMKSLREEQAEAIANHGQTSAGFAELRLTMSRLEEQMRPPALVAPSEDVMPEEWRLGDEQRPAALIQRIGGVTDLNRQGSAISKRFGMSDAATARLAEVFRSLPGMVSAASNLHSLRVVFSPEVAAGLQSGNLELVQTIGGRWLPLARDARTKEMAGIAHLASNINPVAVLNIGWQIATMVTAQMHLARIHDQLARIDRRLSRLSGLISSETFGKLSGGSRYLHQLGGILTEGFASPADLLAYTIKIEDIEQDCISIFEASRYRIINTTEGLEISKQDRKNVELDPFGETLAAFGEDTHLMVNALHVRLLALQIKRLMPSHDSVAITRLSEVAKMREDIDCLSGKFLDAARCVAPEETKWSKLIPRWFYFKKRRRFQGMRDYEKAVKRAVRQRLNELDRSRMALTSAVERPQKALSLNCVYDSDTHEITQIGLGVEQQRAFRRVLPVHSRLYVLPAKKADWQNSMVIGIKKASIKICNSNDVDFTRKVSRAGSSSKPRRKQDDDMWKRGC